jgi:multidrug efflux pump
VNPSRLFILRPVATSLLAVAILLLGVFAYRVLPVSALPEVDYPTIDVVTGYPGAGPQIVASTVTAPLERQLGQMPGLSQMSSASAAGASTITLRFNLELPLDVAEQQVQAAINAALPLLPAGLSQPPIYRKVNPADAPVLTLALTSPTLSLRALRELADARLVPKLSQATGVGLVSVGGGQQPAIVVQADPARLRSHGMTLEDLRGAIRDANSNQATGALEGAARATSITLGAPVDSAAAFGRLVVAQRDGAVVRLEDVARVVDGAQDARLAAWSGEKPAIVLHIRRQPGANVVEVVDRIRQLLPQLQATLPAAVDVATLSDRTETVRAAVRDVQLELVFAVALVVLVIFLFLGSGTATAIPGVVVPLSLIGTFAVMYLAGLSVNNLTLMALIVATGFMVDDAIVMIENITRHVEAGEGPLAAALKGSRQIAFTVVSLTVSLVAVLIPLLFMGGLVGRLFREFAITLAVAVLLSCVISLTLTPMMCARMLRRVPESQQGRLARLGRAWHDRVLARYARGLDWVLARQTATLLAMGAMAALAVTLYAVTPRGLFPAQESGDIQGISVASPTISFAAMGQRQQALAREILRDPRGRERGLLRRRRRAFAQQRPPAHPPRAAGAARPHAQGDGTAGRGGREGRRHQALHAAGTRPDDRRSGEFGAVPALGRERRPRTTRAVDAARGRKAAGRASAGRRGQRPAGQRPRSVCEREPRPRQPLRHHVGGGRRCALQRVRPASGEHAADPGEPAPRDPRGLARRGQHGGCDERDLPRCAGRRRRGGG